MCLVMKNEVKGAVKLLPLLGYINGAGVNRLQIIA